MQRRGIVAVRKRSRIRRCSEESDLPRDIFEFWSGLPGDARVHPADAKVFDTVKHEFKLDCLVGVFRGPLKTAPVVLLFLSPGFDEGDSQHARSPVGQACYAKMRIGEHNFPNKEEHESASAWSEKIVRQFGLNYKDVLSKLAFLNMGAYKSKDFNDWPMLAALPSSRVALDWAQSVLFPQAEAGSVLSSAFAHHATGDSKKARGMANPCLPPSAPEAE